MRSYGPGSSRFGDANLYVDLAVFGELERIRQQVFQHLLQPLDVGVDSVAACGLQLERKIKALVLGDLAECAVDVVRRSVKRTSPISTAIVPDSILDKIENVVDQRQQIGAGRMNRLRELDLFVVQIPSGFSESIFDRISMLFSGVRSSCDMLARNSDLYFELKRKLFRPCLRARPG